MTGNLPSLQVKKYKTPRKKTNSNIKQKDIKAINTMFLTRPVKMNSMFYLNSRVNVAVKPDKNTKTKQIHIFS